MMHSAATMRRREQPARRRDGKIQLGRFWGQHQWIGVRLAGGAEIWLSQPVRLQFAGRLQYRISDRANMRMDALEIVENVEME